MSYYLTSEREEELIEKIARFIVDKEMSIFAEIMLGAYGTTDMMGLLSFSFFYPWATLFLGRTGQELSELLGLNASINSKRILERVKELEEKREFQKEKYLLENREESVSLKLKTKLSKNLSSFLSKLKKG